LQWPFKRLLRAHGAVFASEGCGASVDHFADFGGGCLGLAVEFVS
jgi:hypothetical protein